MHQGHHTWHEVSLACHYRLRCLASVAAVVQSGREKDLAADLSAVFKKKEEKNKHRTAHQCKAEEIFSVYQL